MPLPQEVSLQKTNDAREFEDMVCDVCKEVFKGEFQRYGRLGQKQYGIDIISIDLQESIAVQCKNYVISESDVRDIIDEVMKFPGSVSKFIIATSSNRDTKLQNYIMELNQSVNLTFNVTIMFWEEISSILSKNEDILLKYYPTMKKDTIEWLVLEFNRLIKEYDILGFVNVDPVIGMPKHYPLLVDNFVLEVGLKLTQVNTLQHNPKFLAINAFRDMIDNYNGCLSEKLFPATTLYTLQNPYDLEDVRRENSKIINEIINYKKNLDELYGKINDNCSMFLVMPRF